MNITSRPVADEKSSRRILRPSRSGRLKSGAGVPNGSMCEGVRDMEMILQSSGRSVEHMTRDEARRQQKRFFIELALGQ